MKPARLLLIVLTMMLPTTASATAHTPNPLACQGKTTQEGAQCRKQQQAHLLQHTCSKPRPGLSASHRITVKRFPATRHQRRVLTRALAEARRKNTHPNVTIALVAAITQESAAKNLADGHGTSVGVLQLINIHGSVAWRLQIENSVGWFLRGANRTKGHKTTAPGTLAQQVQRSGHPKAYDQWVSEAKRTVRIWNGPCPK